MKKDAIPGGDAAHAETPTHVLLIDGHGDLPAGSVVRVDADRLAKFAAEHVNHRAPSATELSLAGFHG